MHLENNEKNVCPKMREAILVVPTTVGDHMTGLKKTKLVSNTQELISLQRWGTRCTYLGT